MAYIQVLSYPTGVLDNILFMNFLKNKHVHLNVCPIQEYLSVCTGEGGGGVNVMAMYNILDSHCMILSYRHSC